MRTVTLFTLILVVACIPGAAFADSNVSFLNSGGTITASGGDDLSLTNSSLAGISNLGLGYDCPPPACNGTVTFTTGSQGFAGSLTTGAASWSGGSGSNITVTSNTGPGGGFVFTGAFSAATWTKTGSGKNAFWSFVGTIANGILTLDDGTTFTDINGATIDLTTIGGPVVVNFHNTWTDSGGSTTFPSPVPEPGTLTLLGSGLVAIGILARRKRPHKENPTPDYLGIK